MPRALPKKKPPAPFDETLSRDVLAMLNERISTMPGRYREELVTYLKGDVDDTFATRALAWLWEVDPALNTRLRDASGQKKHDACVMSASLMVWAQNQPWAGDVKTGHMLHKWQGIAVNKKGSKGYDYLPNAHAFLDRLVPLLPSILDTQREHLAAALYNKLVWLTAGPSLARWSEPALVWPLAHAMGTLAAMCPNDISSDGLPLPEQWVRNTQETFAEANTQRRLNMSVALLSSDIPHDLKARVLKDSPGHVWCQPDIARLILATLPADEGARFAHLPWEKENVKDGGATQRECAIRTNKTVLQCYCPTLAPLAELVATDSDWLAKDTMASMVERFNASNTPTHEAFALPTHLEVFS